MGRQPSIEHAPHLLGEESPLGIPSISSDKNAQNPGSRWKFKFKDPSKAVTEKAPMPRTQAPSVDDPPRLWGQECPLVEQMRRIRRTYADKDEAENDVCPFVEQMRRIRRANAEKDSPTPSTEKAPQDPEPRERGPPDRRAGIPRGIYKSGLRWGGW